MIRIYSIPSQRIRDKYSNSETEETLIFMMINYNIYIQYFFCSLMNTIKPGSIKKINQSNMAFKMMENIENFLKAAENYGCKKIDIFQVVDLYERQNMTQVVNGIYALGRVVSLGTFQSEQKLEIGFYYMIILTNFSSITNSKINSCSNIFML